MALAENAPIEFDLVVPESQPSVVPVLPETYSYTHDEDCEYYLHEPTGSMLLLEAQQEIKKQIDFSNTSIVGRIITLQEHAASLLGLSSEDRREINDTYVEIASTIRSLGRKGLGFYGVTIVDTKQQVILFKPEDRIIYTDPKDENDVEIPKLPKSPHVIGLMTNNYDPDSRITFVGSVKDLRFS